MQRRLPLSEETTLRFIYWLAKDRNLKANTINSYLAGIRQLHVARGFPDPKIRSDAVNLVLKGLKNKENKENRKKETDRKPITRDTMALLKSRIRSWKTSPTNQRMVWAVATNLFHGAFRIGELLPAKSSEFDPDFELMTDDVHMTDRSNQFRLKCPKEDRSGKSTIVDVYATGGPFCPVHALRRWRQLIGDWTEKQPAFRWEDGRTFTQNQFRKIIDERLQGVMEKPSQVFCTHSFRIGAASMMGTLGYDDEDVKAVGRWSSRAFEKYMKLPRTKRIAVAKLMKI